MGHTTSGILILLIVALLMFAAWYFLKRKAYRKSVLFVLLIGLLMRVVASTDPYLHSWDERYHALVAKNLIEHPLTPTLHEHPVLEYNNANWVGSNIWLAKPSFPLWIMAGSISVFGNNLFAVRLPSVLLGVLAVWLTFLIGRQLFDERVGVLAAFFHAINGLVVELIGGRVSSDHVELCFIVLVELAIYFAVINLGRKPLLRYSFFTGLFMGLAFLSKWYPAFIVLPVWFTLFFTRKTFSWKELFKHGGMIIGASLLVILPWTIYMLQTYPTEMEAILFNALSAYASTVESHEAPFYYYWHKLLVIFNELIYIALFFFIYRSLQIKSRFRFHFFGLLVWIFVPMIIFSMADTKRFTYILLSAPAFFIVIAWFWFYLKDHFANSLNNGKKWIAIITMLLLIALPVRYMIERSKLLSSNKNELIPEFYNYPEETRKDWNDKTIVFGTDDYIEIMFHTNVYAAYRQLPSQERFDELKEEGFGIVMLIEGEFVGPVYKSRCP